MHTHSAYQIIWNCQTNSLWPPVEYLNRSSSQTYDSIHSILISALFAAQWRLWSIYENVTRMEEQMSSWQPSWTKKQLILRDAIGTFEVPWQKMANFWPAICGVTRPRGTTYTNDSLGSYPLLARPILDPLHGRLETAGSLDTYFTPLY